jgi:hypothetical protein
MCRFYKSGLDRYYRLCYRKVRRRGEHIPWPAPRPDIRNVKGCVPLRRLPRAKQFKLFTPPPALAIA